LTSAALPPPPDARSAVLPDGRDMHPEPEELHGGLHRQQRRGPAPPRARRMVGVAGEAGRRRAPSAGNEPHGRGRAPDGGAPAERPPRGVLRSVLRPARNRRLGALSGGAQRVSGRAQRDRTAEPEVGGAREARVRRRSRRRVVIVQRRRRRRIVPGVSGWRIGANLGVVVAGGVGRRDGGFLPPERPRRQRVARDGGVRVRVRVRSRRRPPSHPGCTSSGPGCTSSGPERRGGSRGEAQEELSRRTRVASGSRKAAIGGEGRGGGADGSGVEVGAGGE
jgi:hypothetical protein